METMNPIFGKQLGRRAFLGAGLACLAPSTSFGVNAASAGSVETLSGEGFAESATVRRSLQTQSGVFVGDIVGTGPQSRLALRLGAATQLKLGPEARVRLDSYITSAGGTLELQGGAILFDTGKQKGQGTSIRSPFGLIAVRGTRFFAGPSAGAFGVFVARGRVNVTAAGRRIELAQGMGTDIAYPGAPPTAPAAWGSVRVQHALSLAAYNVRTYREHRPL